VDNAEWRKLQKKNWPTGSLERAFPGNKGVLSLLERAKLKPLPAITAPQAPLQHDHEDENVLIQQAMSQAIKTIDVVYPVDKILTQAQEQHIQMLNQMPTRTVKEIHAWRDAWIAFSKKVRLQT